MVARVLSRIVSTVAPKRAISSSRSLRSPYVLGDKIPGKPAKKPKQDKPKDAGGKKDGKGSGAESTDAGKKGKK